ncbi:DNA polymerase/3'-5' exonuclease PolX [Alkalicoccobacillus plakortidis]|uniref:DNA polymerase beta n=1 Tax=Alkalicoccobacillus plakortidis TaxID=444060 RepID=A0ABT0XH82_9BACI|nr:DNA polymerase/3'-5' exonuclease PolX [Alkalicoccobacillus plakortidis]MCM2675234.1 DNA polymerase/3'-5' exonuclease PolX [Alkalicoccobacillus plakortidis]
MDKKKVIQILEAIAVYMEIKGENSFKVSAYRKAAKALESVPETLEEIKKAESLDGIGKGTASVIEELKQTGQSSLHDELAASFPEGLLPLLKLPGLGGKKVGKLYQELGVTDLASLKQACEDEKIRGMAGFGAKSEEKILAAIDAFQTRPERVGIAVAIKAADFLLDKLQYMEGIIRYELAGSLRRMEETVKDIDFILSTDDREQVKEQLLQLDGILQVVGAGDTKVSIEITVDELVIGVDFRLVQDDEFASALLHFTGSKDHNVKLRQLAKERGEQISEYGVLNKETDQTTVFKDEHSFYAHFDLAYVSPEARLGKDELVPLTEKIDYPSDSSIQSDLHMHTVWSDGAHSIKEMAEGAAKRGYSHIAITDHSQFLRVANGLTVERLKEQHQQIKEMNKQSNIHIFTGIEMDILPDGTLDYEDDVLQDIDFVIASIHSSFSQSEEMIMSRLKTALFHPHVDLIAHPTGRIIGKRDGYAVNVPQLIKWAAESGTALELNASPERLDLSAEWIRLAHEHQVPIAINTDAHHVDRLAYIRYGLGVARKAGIPTDSIINTWSLERLQTYLNTDKSKRMSSR